MYFLRVLGNVAPCKIPEYIFWGRTFSLQQGHFDFAEFYLNLEPSTLTPSAHPNLSPEAEWKDSKMDLTEFQKAGMWLHHRDCFHLFCCFCRCPYEIRKGRNKVASEMVASKLFNRSVMFDSFRENEDSSMLHATYFVQAWKCMHGRTP